MLLLLVASVYFYYNWEYFRLVNRLLNMESRHTGVVLASFVINYLFFIGVSMLEYPLIVNWLLFAVLLWFETLIYNRSNRRSALFCMLVGIISGLSVNIFFRSVIAMVLVLPLQCFDNHVWEVGNLKGLPVFLGFLMTGVSMRCLCLPGILERLRLIVAYPRHQTFLLQIMSGFFVYLFLNLLLYSTPLNDLLLKVWSIKSCLFCLIGLYIAGRYTRRICELEEYREKNREIELEIKEGRQEEAQLRRKASVDMLTGLYNRQCAEEALDSMMRQDQPFTLCFIDLDGLKHVNDQYGHEEGDRYLLTVSEQIGRVCRKGRDRLFRYGGDEFLLLLVDMEAEAALKRVSAVNAGLGMLGTEQAYPYPLSVSYGAANSRMSPDWKDMVRQADERMYEQKQLKRAGRDQKGHERGAYHESV